MTTCPHCHGTGKVTTDPSIVDDLVEALQNFLILEKNSPRSKDQARVFVDTRDWEAFMSAARNALAKAGGS